VSGNEEEEEEEEEEDVVVGGGGGGAAVVYGLDDRCSIPGRGWDFFSLPPRPDRPWCPFRILSNVTKSPFLGCKVAEA
jgi:hypothetical protein